MGLLKNIFGSSSEKDENTINWIALTEADQLVTITEKSITKPQIIFKHSTRCGISRMVINQFVDNYSLSEKEADLYYLDLLSFREVSNEVGYKFQVLHQSPQLLVIKNGVVVTHANHGAIIEVELNRFK